MIRGQASCELAVARDERADVFIELFGFDQSFILVVAAMRVGDLTINATDLWVLNYKACEAALGGDIVSVHSCTNVASQRTTAGDNGFDPDAILDDLSN